MDQRCKVIIHVTIALLMPFSLVFGQPGIRLVNGPTNTSGRVEIMYNGVWHTVCDDDFDRKALKVVCRMVGVELNDSYGVFHHMAYIYGPGNGNDENIFDNYKCTGQESSILNCPGIDTNDDCGNHEDVGVDCSAVRIGANCRSGGDQIFHDPCGGITTMCINSLCTCADGFNDSNGPILGGVCLIECEDGQFNANATTCIQKIPLGEACPGPSETDSKETCEDKNAKCVVSENSTDYTCQCILSHFDDNGSNAAGGECKPKLSLGENCTDPVLSGLDPAAQCAVDNSNCSVDGYTHRCKCLPTHYDDNGQTAVGGQCMTKLTLNEECPGIISKNDTCRDPNSECQPKGTSNTYTCVCRTGFYASSREVTNVVCTKEHKYGENCTVGIQCSTWLANCSEDNIGSKKCMCPNDYIFNETTNECKGKEITHCLGDITSGIVWRNTPLESFAYENCPEGYEGTVSRYCTKDGVFRKPLLNCSLLAFKDTLEKIINSNGTVDTGETLDQLAKDIQVPDQLYSGDTETIENIMKSVAETSSAVVDKGQVENFLSIVDVLTDPKKPGGYAGRIENTGKGAEELLDTVETFIGNAAKNLENDTELNTPNMLVKITKTDDKTNKTELNFDVNGGKNESSNTKLSVSLKVAAIKGKNVSSFAIIVYANLSNILPRRFEEIKDEDRRASIESKVISINLYPKQPEKLEPPLELEFPIQFRDEMVLYCAHWNDSAEDGKGAWSTKGCKIVPSSRISARCQCEHLTNFAVLVSPTRPTSESQKAALSILSMVGCGISMTFLLITMIANGLYWRHIKSDSNTLPMVLCGSLFAGYCLFVFGVNQTESKAVCTTIAVLLHYTFLLVFFVMLAEGLYITIRVVFIFHVQSHVKGLLISALILPAIVVGIAMSVTKLEGYGDDEYCWLAYGHWVFWTFAGPAALIVLVNMVILGIVLVKMYGTSWIQNMDFRKRTKTMAQKLAFLVPLLGVTWLFGFLAVNEDTFALQVLFLLCNCLQGPVIFVFHVLLNKQLKTAIQAAGKRKQTLDDLSTDTRRHGKDDGTSTMGHSTHATETSFVSKDYKSETDDQVKMIDKEKQSPAPLVERRLSLEEKVMTENIADKNVRKSTLMKLQTELRGRLNNMFTTVAGGASTVFTRKNQNTDDNVPLRLDHCDETEPTVGSSKEDAGQKADQCISNGFGGEKSKMKALEKTIPSFTDKCMLKATSSLIDLEIVANAGSAGIEGKELNKTRSSHALGSLLPAMSFNNTDTLFKSDFQHNKQEHSTSQVTDETSNAICTESFEHTSELTIKIKANERLSNLTPIDENMIHSSTSNSPQATIELDEIVQETAGDNGAELVIVGIKAKAGEEESTKVCFSMSKPEETVGEMDKSNAERMFYEQHGEAKEFTRNPFDIVAKEYVATSKIGDDSRVPSSDNGADPHDVSPGKSITEKNDCNLDATDLKSINSSDSCGSVSSDSDASSDTDDGNPKSYEYVINPFEGDDSETVSSDSTTNTDSSLPSENKESIHSDRL